MAWLSVIMFIITNIPKLITLIKQILELFESRQEAKAALPGLLDTEIKKSDVGPLRQIIRARRDARK